MAARMPPKDAGLDDLPAGYSYRRGRCSSQMPQITMTELQQVWRLICICELPASYVAVQRTQQATSDVSACQTVSRKGMSDVFDGQGNYGLKGF